MDNSVVKWNEYTSKEKKTRIMKDEGGWTGAWDKKANEYSHFL